MSVIRIFVDEENKSVTEIDPAGMSPHQVVVFLVQTLVLLLVTHGDRSATREWITGISKLLESMMEAGWETLDKKRNT